MSHTLNSGDPPVPQKPTITLDAAIRRIAASVMEVPLPSNRNAVFRSGMLNLLELTPVLRQIDDTVILLHYPGMF